MDFGGSKGTYVPPHKRNKNVKSTSSESGSSTLLQNDVPAFLQKKCCELEIKKPTHAGIGLLMNKTAAADIKDKVNKLLASPERKSCEIWRLCCVPISNDEHFLWKYCENFAKSLSSEEKEELLIGEREDITTGLRPNHYLSDMYTRLLDCINWDDKTNNELVQNYVFVCSIEKAAPRAGYMNANIGIFGGHVNRGESCLTAAWREFHEESRIHFTPAEADATINTPASVGEPSASETARNFIITKQEVILKKFMDSKCLTKPLPVMCEICGTLLKQPHWMQAFFLILSVDDSVGASADVVIFVHEP